jgi:hypothetical protein
MQFEDIVDRFVMAAINDAHALWDFIVLDGGEFDMDFGRVSMMCAPQPANEQYYLKNRVSALMSATAGRAGGSATRKVPPDGKAVVPEEVRTGKEFWFLEITWDNVPTGLALREVGEGLFKRVGFFKMGRNQVVDPDDMPMPVENLGPRPWDWDESLNMCTITII